MWTLFLWFTLLLLLSYSSHDILVGFKETKVLLCARVKICFPFDISTFSVKIDAVTHMFLKDDFTGKSRMRCTFETICKSVFLSIILKGLVRWAGAQHKASYISSTELHLGSLILSKMKWKMTDAVLSFFSFWSGRVPIKHLEILHVLFTKVKPTARIYINVLFFRDYFLVLLKDKKFRPKSFLYLFK